MVYCYKLFDPSFTSFVNFASGLSGEVDSTLSSCSTYFIIPIEADATPLSPSAGDSCSRERNFLDLYAGCGAMSTGICLGDKLSGVKLTTIWAADVKKAACKSLPRNHPKTQIKCEVAEDFLELLKAWDDFCLNILLSQDADTDKDGSSDYKSNLDEADGVYEVDQIMGVFVLETLMKAETVRLFSRFAGKDMVLTMTRGSPYLV